MVEDNLFRCNLNDPSFLEDTSLSVAATAKKGGLKRERMDRMDRMTIVFIVWRVDISGVLLDG